MNAVPHNVAVVILAAGKGARLGCADIPKAMLPIGGKPMTAYLVETLESMGFTKEQIVLVVGFQKEKVKEYFGNQVTYAVQDEQLGTGHAVAVAEPYIRNKFDHTVVVYGDMPLISANSTGRLVQNHTNNNTPMTMLTALTPDFAGDHAPFAMFGRVVRNSNGEFEKIVEWKDASEKQLEITELSTGIFCFQTDWLFENLRRLNADNVQKEYYLVDLVALAMESGGVSTAEVSLSEVYGVNTAKDLETILKKVALTSSHHLIHHI